MTLTIPTYIDRAKVVGSPIRHAWSDADARSKFMGDERLANRIRKICPRGVAALTAGFAEWVAWRLSKEVRDAVLLNYVEAYWAGIVDWRYMRLRKTVPKAPHLLKEWTGPVRGPVIKTCNDLDTVKAGVEQSMGAAVNATILSQLTLYVMPSKEPFMEWRRFAIDRLAKSYPVKKEGEIGPPIPREVLDPDVDYKPEMAKELIAAYLKRLDAKKNPFLKAPDEMKAEGFTGVPYTY